jgi:hypothetical protein
MMTASKWRVFIGAQFLGGAVSALVQDAFGLERWVALVRANWIPAVYSVPLAVFVGIVGVFLIYVSPETKHKEEK